MPESNHSSLKPDHELIAACARIIYEAEGRPEGKALEHWLLAEQLLIADALEESRRRKVRTSLPSIPPRRAQRTRATSTLQTSAV